MGWGPEGSFIGKMCEICRPQNSVLIYLLWKRGGGGGGDPCSFHDSTMASMCYVLVLHEYYNTDTSLKTCK